MRARFMCYVTALWSGSMLSNFITLANACNKLDCPLLNSIKCVAVSPLANIITFAVFVILWQYVVTLTDNSQYDLRIRQSDVAQHRQHFIDDLPSTMGKWIMYYRLFWKITIDDTCALSSLSKIRSMHCNTLAMIFRSLWFFSKTIFNLGNTILRIDASSNVSYTLTTATRAALYWKRIENMGSSLICIYCDIEWMP